jgi:hypothetical protein
MKIVLYSCLGIGMGIFSIFLFQEWRTRREIALLTEAVEKLVDDSLVIHFEPFWVRSEVAGFGLLLRRNSAGTYSPVSQVLEVAASKQSVFEPLAGNVAFDPKYSNNGAFCAVVCATRPILEAAIAAQTRFGISKERLLLAKGVCL